MTQTPFARAARCLTPVALALACVALPGVSAAQEDQTAGGAKAEAPATPSPQTEEDQVVGPGIVTAGGSNKPRATADRPERYDSNIKIDVTITDQSGSNAPVVKTLTAVLADREEGSLRSIVQVPATGPWESVDPKVPPSMPVRQLEDLPLNVDLRTWMVSPTRVRLYVSLNYRTIAKSPDSDRSRAAGITEKFTVLLDHGKPAVVSQSADAATDRKVTIELKATILK